MVMIIIFTIVIGALIGWLAGIFMKSKHGFWTNCLIGIIGPPVGSALFVGCAVGKISIEKAAKGMLPFYLAMIAVLVLVTFVPAMSLFIPSLLH